MEEVRRRTSLAPLASPCFILSLLSLETEGFFAFQRRAGITSIVRWNLRLVIFGVEYCNTRPMCIAMHLQSILQCFRCSSPEEGEMLSVLLPSIAMLLGKSWWLGSLGCSPFLGIRPICSEYVSVLFGHLCPVFLATDGPTQLDQIVATGSSLLCFPLRLQIPHPKEDKACLSVHVLPKTLAIEWSPGIL